MPRGAERCEGVAKECGGGGSDGECEVLGERGFCSSEGIGGDCV